MIPFLIKQVVPECISFQESVRSVHKPWFANLWLEFDFRGAGIGTSTGTGMDSNIGTGTGTGIGKSTNTYTCTGTGKYRAKNIDKGISIGTGN